MYRQTNQSQQQDNSLSAYLPKNPLFDNKNHQPNPQLIQKQIQKTKKQLSSLQNVQKTKDNEIRNKLQSLKNIENKILNIYSEKQMYDLFKFRGSKGNVQGRGSQCRFISQSLESVYLEQMRLSSEIQSYIDKVSEKTAEYSIQFSKNSKKQQQKQSNSLPQLPKPQQIRSQVIQQINKCQQNFTQLMQNTQNNIEHKLKNLVEYEKVLIQQMSVVIQSRIKHIQSNYR